MENLPVEELSSEHNPAAAGEDLCRLIFNHTELSLILLDQQLRIIECNPFALRKAKVMLGIDVVPGMSILEMAPPERHEPLRKLYEEVFHGETKKLIREFDAGTGLIVFEIDIRPVYGADGRLAGALITGKDISENKKSEALLKEAEERWRFALDGANQGAWDWNLKTGEVFYSSSYKRLYGYTDNDSLVSIHDWQSRIHPDDQLQMQRAIKEHITSEDPYQESKYRIRNKQGEYRWIWARGMVMGKDEQGNALRMIGTHTDITDQVNAEQHYRSLFKFNPLPCWIYSIGTGKFLEVNEAAIHQYGFSEQEFLQGGLQMMHPAFRLEELSRRLSTEAGLDNQSLNNWVHQKKNGELIFVDLRITNISYKGEQAKLVVAHEVTDKVRIENDLRQSNERFLYAAEASSEALWEWDFYTGQFFASQAYTDIFGWQVNEQRTFDEWHDYIHPEDRDETISSYYGSLDDPGTYHWKKEYRYRKSDGSYANVIDKARILRNEEGKPVKVIGAIQDITEQKRTEEELRRSNERYKHVILATSDIVWDWDINSEVILWSDNYTKVFGWPLPDNKLLKDDNCVPRFHPDDRERVINSLKQTILDPHKTHWHETFRYLKSDGSFAYISDRGYVIRNSKGEAIRMIGAMQDITVQQKAEESIRKSNDRFQMVNRASSDAIYDWDITTNELFWGEGMESLFGHAPADVSFKRWIELLHPADRERVNDSLFTTLKDSNAHLWKEEYRFSRAEGGYCYVLERGFIIRDEQGKAIRLIGSMQDIHERHYQEQMLSLEKTIFELSTNPRLEFKNIVLTLLKGIEDMHEDAYTSVLLLQDDNTMTTLAAPRLPEGYNQLINGLKIGPDIGSCGSAMARKETVIVENIATDPLWAPFKELALGFGLQACWSLPIIHSSGNVMGSFAIYYKKPKGPAREEINTFERVRSIIRVLMENNWSINRIKEAKERFDIMMRATHDLIWDWNLETNVIYRDEMGLRNVYGVKNADSIRSFPRWLQRIHPDDRERVSTVINQILESREQNHFDVEYRFQRDDQRFSFVYDRGIIVRNADGKPIRMIGAAQDVTERKRLEQELLQNELEKQKAINQATVDTQEAERSEIGKELHDNVNQVLTTTKLYLDLALSSPELKDELIVKSNKNIINVINEIRQLSRSLMDPSIGDLGLVDSINDLVDNINLTRKLHVKLQTEKRIESLLDKNHKLTVFRIIQETLNNAIRHARATTVAIKFTKRKNNIEIAIEDDGIGFDPAAIKKGAGLKNIQNRIYLINGTHTIQTAPGKGCRIIIRFPIIQQPLEQPN